MTDRTKTGDDVLSLAWLLRRNLEDEDRRMAVENCNRLICLLETGETPDDLDTLRAIYRTISARLADGSGEGGSASTGERVALLGDHHAELVEALRWATDRLKAVGHGWTNAEMEPVEALLAKIGGDQ